MLSFFVRDRDFFVLQVLSDESHGDEGGVVRGWVRCCEDF